MTSKIAVRSEVMHWYAGFYETGSATLKASLLAAEDMLQTVAEQSQDSSGKQGQMHLIDSIPPPEVTQEKPVFERQSKELLCKVTCPGTAFKNLTPCCRRKQGEEPGARVGGGYRCRQSVGQARCWIRLDPSCH